MKISNSKKQLAKIISENGGWPTDAEWAVQCKSDNTVSFFYAMEPEILKGDTAWYGDYLGAKFDIDVEKVLPNWHRTILSRDEYFHLYPAPDAVAEELEHVWTNPPTIEQLAADYKAKLAIAQKAQEEADFLREEAESALSRLEIAGLVIGLDIAIAVDDAEHEDEPEMVIADWRQWRVGDYISWSIIPTTAEYKIISVHHDEHREIGDFEIMDGHGCVFRCYGDECEFIRRP